MDNSRIFIVGILMVALSGYLSAQAEPCPEVSITFDVPDVICYDPNVNIVDLEVTVSGDNGTGSGEWSGRNISNKEEGFFRTAFAQAGEYTVYYTYTEGMCTYEDSTTFYFSRLPSPFFLASSERDNHICSDSVSILRVLSDYDTTTTNLVWDFDGGTAVEQGSPDSLHVTWDGPDTVTISLQYEQFGCLSPPFLQQLILDPTIAVPEVECDNTLQRVVYEWEDPPYSVATIVFVISGPNGVADTTADRYTIDNLMPGQTVQVRMTTSSENTCDGNFIEPFCTSLACDGNLLDIEPITTACLRNGISDTIDLNYTLLDTITPHTLTWSGAGIYDPEQPRAAIDASMAGQRQWVYLTFSSAVCTVTDSAFFELAPPPEADFTLPSTACVGDAVTAQTEPPQPDTTLLWSFGTATVTGDPAGGTAQLTWDEPGTKQVGLALQVGACVSDTVYRFTNIQSAPDTAVIFCESGPADVLFSWEDVPGATGYEVQVLAGPPGVRISETSYQISGLDEGQEVTIEVTTLGAGVCPRRSVTSSCMPAGCPPITLAIDTITPLCLVADTLIDLTAMLSGDDGSGTLSWSGPMVSGTQWQPDLSLSGQDVLIRAVYQQDVCTYSDSILVAVGRMPSAAFSLPAAICAGETIDIQAQQAGTALTRYTWQTDGLTVDEWQDGGPHTVSWSEEGDHTVSLTAIEGHCESGPVERNIFISAPLDTPRIRCTPDIDRILFEWNAVPEAIGFSINVLQGPSGTFPSDTSLLIENLQPGEEVTIEVIMESDGICPNSRAVQSCFAEVCPPVTIDIVENDLPAFICIDDEPMVFDIEVQTTGTSNTGTFSYSGIGIADSSMFRWEVDPTMAGSSYSLRATYRDRTCIYEDEVMVAVVGNPTAAFNTASATCTGKPVQVDFTGQAGATAIYHWQPIVSQTAGPHMLTLDMEGTQQISLWVEEEGCRSDTVSRSLEVFAPYPAPQITCSSGLDKVVFSWPEEQVLEQEVIYNGPGTAELVADTSWVITGLPTDTEVSIEVAYNDTLFCRNSGATATCRTKVCEDLSLGWSAPATVCEQSQAAITFTATGAGTEGFDVSIDFNGQIISHSGIKEQSTLIFDITEASAFEVIMAELPGAEACSVQLPAPLSIQVQAPVSAGQASPIPDICSGLDTVIQLQQQLQQADTGGNWSVMAGGGDPGNAFQNGMVRVGDLSAGTYRFQYRVEGGVCNDDSVGLSLDILPTPIADAGPDLRLDCQFNLASIGSGNTSSGMVYEWSSANSSGITDVSAAITEVSRPGTYRLTVIDPDSGCSTFDEVMVDAAADMLVPYVSVNDLTCYNSDDGIIRIDSLVGGIAPFNIFLNGTDLGERTSIGNLTAGNYDLLIRSSDGCEAALLLRIESPSQLDVQLTTEQEERAEILLGDSLLLIAQVNIPESEIERIRWTPEGQSSLARTVSPTITSSYHIEVTDRNGCMATDIITVFVVRDLRVFVPNAFSPNGDGQNDLFFLQTGSNIRAIRRLSVFNRWGEMLFDRQNSLPNDPREGWDGTTRGTQHPPGVYIYYAEVELTTGEIVIVEGDVVLLR